ncbi:MAG: cytochrome P450 [Rubrivivax sp.]
MSDWPAATRVQDLPGPRGWPVFGNLFQLPRSTMHLQVEAWGREFGPLFTFRALGRRAVVLGDPDRVAELLRDRPDGWRRTRQLAEVAQELGLKPGLFGAEGDLWRRQRRMVMAGLDPPRVRAYFPALVRVAARLRRRWQKAAAEGRALDLQPELMRYTVDGVAGLAFGVDMNTLESDGVVIQQHLDRLFPALYQRAISPVPYWRWWRRQADRDLDASIAEVRRTIAGFIADARARLAADPARRAEPPNLLEAMIVGSEDGTLQIDDEQIAANVMTLLLAGEDTTANTLAWCLNLLQLNPAALARAAGEVRRVAPDIEAITPEQLGALDWVEGCLHETMRLKPVAPFLVVQALKTQRIGALEIPPDTLLWCALRPPAVDERHFPRPLEFDPARWGEGGHAARRVSMPFGAGPRTCPGRYLALVEMKLVLAMLLAHFEIEAVEAPGGGLARERMSFTMVPVGLKMRLRPRP